MTDLVRMLAAFQRGDTEFEALDAAIARALADAPGRAGEIRSLLDGARDRGLPRHVYAALAGNLDLVAGQTDSTPGDRNDTNAGVAEDEKTLVLDPVGSDPKTAPLPGSVADNARRLEKDSEATEHTLMTYLGRDFTARDTGTQSQTTLPGDIFRRPFTDDEIAGADVTALQGVDTNAARTGEFGPGYMLRGRFQLTTRLGEGGMGAVWRARDMLKVRARDRNPYVAIKLLSGDFREHPEAFIALQRETSKQQRLAHPNVATVFDFDRDENTNTIFMTMEAMQGQSMDKFIKMLPSGGLSVAEAMPIIEQLGAGLSYAHQNGLVHSDLKPGNCFVTKDGVVKLLDFGIARASKSEAHAEGEKTLFDPGELGAITPTYASVEMFEGMDPDPRDDIYALAIMAYQLFTGKHPYGKQNAVKALSMRLEPPYVAKLNKRRNRGLARGLAFRRENRTDTVEAFLEGIRPQQSRIALYAGGGLAAALLVAALAYGPVMDLLRARENESILVQMESATPEGVSNAMARVQALESAEQKNAVIANPRTAGALAALISRSDDRRIDGVLAVLDGLDGKQRREILDAPPVRAAAFRMFEQRIANAFEPANQALDYTAATQALQKLDALYPQSAAVLSISTELKAKRVELLADLEERFETLLEEGAIAPSDSEADVNDVLGQIRAVSPTHPLLTDDRLRFRAAELAEQALAANDSAAAERFVAAGLQFAPDDATLKNLGHRASAAARQLENEKLVADIGDRLQSAERSLASLEAFGKYQQDIVTLAVLEPGNALVAALQARHLSLFDVAFSGALAAKHHADAMSLLTDHAPMLETGYLIQRRRALGAAADGEDPAAAGDRFDAIRQRVDGAAITPAWAAAVIADLRSLIAAAPAADARGGELRARVAEILLDQADGAAAESRFHAAGEWIARARMADPDNAGIAAMTAKAARTESAAGARRERERKLAVLESVKGRFAAAIESNRPGQAKTLLDNALALSGGEPTPAGDHSAFFAGAYADLSAAYAAREDYQSAHRVAAAGLDAYPGFERLHSAREAYRMELDRRALLLALESRFDSLAPLDVDATREEFAQLEQQFPERFDDIRSGFAKRRLARLVDYVRAPAFDPRFLGTQVAAFSALFPNRAGAARRAIAGAAARRIETERGQDALAARMTLDGIRQVLPADPELEKLAKTLPPAPILNARRLIGAGLLNAAGDLLDASRPRLASLPEFTVLERSVAEQRQKATQKFDAFVSSVKKGLLTTREARRRAFNEVLSLWSDNAEFQRVDYVNRDPGACLPDLAGSGRNEEGVCYDFVADNVKGPLLVVIPAARGSASPFAIGKYEVTVAEFNRYCEITGSCAPIAGGNDKLPVTGISIRDAQGYAKWLSGRASAIAKKSVVYRLPNDEEWRHAAAANGDLPARGINCRPEGGATLSSGIMRSEGGTLSLGAPIGRALVSATFGGENGWGVVNAAGNAQEWVTGGTGLAATGGAFQDPVAACNVHSRRVHDGGADAITGFRLLRELG